MNNMLIGGAHRGARTILTELNAETVRLYEPSWIVADPKERRAADLVILAQKRYPRLNPQPLSLRVQDALPLSRERDTVVLALDTISDTVETLAARQSHQRLSFQFAGRGPGSSGTRLAIQGTLCPGDEQSERGVSLLLPTLGAMSRAASSRELTGPDPVTAQVLQPLRQAAARLTCLHLSEKEREPWDLSGGPLSVVFGQTTYPLVPVQGMGAEKYSDWKERALESAGSVLAKHTMACGPGSRAAVVAVVIPESQTIHFLRVCENGSGKRSVVGVTTFALPRVPQRSATPPAVFTD